MTQATQTRDPQAAATAIKWRAGVRRTPLSSHDLILCSLTAKESHPLAATFAIKENGSHVQVLPVSGADPVLMNLLVDSTSSSLDKPPLSKRKSSGNTAALVPLQDGDVDPLGVFASVGDTPGGSLESVATAHKSAGLKISSVSSLSTGVTETREETAAPPTVKQQWKAHTDRLLAKFADHIFKIKASMLEVNDLENEISFVPKSDYQKSEDAAEASVIKKTRARLEQLERVPSSSGSSGSGPFSHDEQTIEISQSQYVAKVKEMQTQLVANWQQNQKVAALRIAIKCVKLLADTNTAPQLYPCVFVLISEVLDTFGGLVFERIHTRASEDENGQPLPTPLGEHFTSSDVNIHAMETCRNWFYKTACIRELLPRIYVEIALLGCYRFLCDGEYPQIVARLANMIKGIGEPMVALYARLYLALTSSELLDATAPYEQTVVASSSLFDYFYAFDWFRQHKLEHWLLTHNMESAEYLALHSPAVEWLVKCVATGATQDTFDTLLAHYQEFSDNSMVLKHLCECFGSQFYASAPSEMLELIRAASPSQFSTCHLYSLLAVQLSSAPSIAERENGGKLQFLNESWGSITSQEDLEQYMECAAAFMKLIVAHFSHREALILLKDVIRHLNAATPDQLTAKAYNLLGALLENVVFGAKRHFEFFSKLIPSPGFLALMGMFQRESSVGVAKKVLQAFVGGTMKQKAGRSSSLRLHVVGPEAAVAHTLLVICCRVHDALDSLSTSSERSEATRDISAFISRLGYVNTTATSASARAQDKEQEALLMLYTDCRRAFYKLEPVKALLSRMVLRLAMTVHKRLGEGVASITGGKKRDQAGRHLIQSCLAFAHITIPSIEAGLERVQLLISAANVALVTNCIPQMDALVKAAIVQFAELDPAVMSSTTCRGDDESAANETSRMVAVLTVGAMGLSAGNEGVERVVRAIAQLMSILVYAPSLNDDDAFYFVTALRKAVLDRLVWLDPSGSSPRCQLEAGAARVRVLLLFAQLYALWSQKTLPNQLEGVDSNDALYGGDDAFFDEVQTRFSSTIEEVLREIEAMDGTVESESEKPSTVVVWATQIELMLDFVNEVVPVLEYDAIRATGSFKMEASDTGKSGSRRRKNPRGGAALIRKCLAYTFEKVGLLKQAALKGDPASVTSSRVKTSELVSWTCRYYEDTRTYVMEFLKELS